MTVATYFRGFAWLILSLLALSLAALFSYYGYHAYQLRPKFAALENPRLQTCAVNQRWQIPLTLEQYPNRLLAFTQTIERDFGTVIWRNIMRADNATLSEKLIATLEIKRRYSEEQQLLFGLNYTPMAQQDGCTIIGLNAGAQYYFAKTLDQLSIAEMTLLIAISRAPNYYNPVTHPAKALERRNTALEILLHKNLITQQEYEQALKEPLFITGQHFP